MTGPGPTPLDRRVREELAARGPMRLDRFWTIALFDREHGYYTTRDPFGTEGDFTTAPEISQMFGELIGAWLVAAWRGLGRPSPFLLCEIGPGRGTLMADILRSVRQLDPDMMRAARVRLVETSDRLAAGQIEHLSRFDLPIVRHRRLDELERLPLLLVGNELLDAVAIRQLRFSDGAWRERVIALGPDGALQLSDGEPMRSVPAALAKLGRPPEGAVFEFSPERDAIVASIAGHLAARSGAALLIDYGHAASGFGDTLQALRQHRFAPALDQVGAADITSHVDFERVLTVAQECGVAHGALATQGDFLLSLGLLERAGALGAPLDEAGRSAVTQAVHRLAGTGPDEMGALFKVAALSSRALALPPFSS
ncbi:class I SAM-dependent methyltransferase [Aureimonas ureilytica]|uniref:class I SAM-dependent methyltransferase n=1 Tax=Aureimonas ureilytica TaxID=401562 RepID=UPI00037CE1B4|nr:SAM-dependent methyltransferase [Aureimonas ureilytica]